jgi:hypothetical protein
MVAVEKRHRAVDELILAELVDQLFREPGDGREQLVPVGAEGFDGSLGRRVGFGMTDANRDGIRAAIEFRDGRDIGRGDASARARVGSENLKLDFVHSSGN